MLIKFIAVILLLVILFIIGRGMAFWVRHRQGDEVASVRALTWRVVLSISLFAVLLLLHIFSGVN